MNNEEEDEEEKKEMTSGAWLFMGGFWALCFYLRFFTYSPSAESGLNYILIVLGLIMVGGFFAEIKQAQAKTEEKVYYITPDHSRIEQEQAELRAAREASAKEREIQERIKKAIDNL